jgi:uncharacterized LabA/DUF88 family protein
MRLRTSFLVDGFNLYHSIRDIAYYNNGVRYKWLNISSLCKSLFHKIGNADLEEIYYFSAYAFHLKDSGVITRHQTYIKCLEDTGIQKVISEFKPKQVQCPLFRKNTKTCSNCYGIFVRHEEKETDVAVACKLLKLLSKDEADCVVLVTGDTDLAPSVEIAHSLYPTKNLLFAFPYRRANAQLKQMCPNSFKLTIKDYQNHQFTNPYPMSDGTLIDKPLNW